MKKETSSSGGRARWYDDACGAAHGLELLGERWALLIVRELMFGPRRFGAIRAGLPGISAKALTERLEGLQRAGIVMRRMLPAPASAPAYELTPWGYEAEPIFRMLGGWAARSPAHDPSLPLSAASLMLSFRTMFAPERVRGAGGALGFLFGDDAFVVRFDASGLQAARAPVEGVETVVSGAPAAVAGLVYGGAPLQALEASGALSIAGDRAQVERFAQLFPLPEKAPTPPAAGG